MDGAAAAAGTATDSLILAITDSPSILPAVDAGLNLTATGSITEHAIDVLKRAIKDHDRPASILIDHGTQLYASSGECKRKGVSAFERELVSLGIRHILARVGHLQTNDKLERFHGELQRKLHLFEESADRTVRRTGSRTDYIGGPFNAVLQRDAITRFVEWYNYIRPHMSLDLDNLETPTKAFARKMPPEAK